MDVESNFDVMYADKNEEYLIVVCLKCGQGLTEPLLVLTANRFDEVTGQHKSECSGK